METRCYVSLSFHYIIVQSLPAPREFLLAKPQKFCALVLFHFVHFSRVSGKKGSKSIKNEDLH